MEPRAIALFRELVDCSPSERDAYFLRHDLPAELRANVESLLRFDREASDSIRDGIVQVAVVLARGRVDRVSCDAPIAKGIDQSPGCGGGWTDPPTDHGPPPRRSESKRWRPVTADMLRVSGRQDTRFCRDVRETDRIP